MTLKYGTSPGYTITLGPSSQKPKQPVSFISTSSSFIPTWPQRPRFLTSSFRDLMTFLAPKALHPVLAHTVMIFLLGSLRAIISLLNFSNSARDFIVFATLFGPPTHILRGFFPPLRASHSRSSRRPRPSRAPEHNSRDS